MKNKFIKKIESTQAVVGVIGLGYVGLPLLLEFALKEFPVIGFDLDKSKLKMLKSGQSYIRHISSETIQSVFASNSRADATSHFDRISECDAILICVPTPLTKNMDPDMTYIESTANQIGPFLQKGQLVLLESTTFPGTTEEILIPILEKTSNLKAGEDFFVAYSPEREDPNNKEFTTSSIPKVVGGINQSSLQIAQALYNRIICETVPVSDCRTAEATKLMENIFRSVNIALVNELKMVFTEMNIDIWEVIRAASTKPFGFMPFYPGPGLGGHCIPIDPFYLSWKAREYRIPTKFIELAGQINTSMPAYVIQMTIYALNKIGKSLSNSRLLLVGLAYKKNVDDVRESPSFELWKQLALHGVTVDYYDPYCPEVPTTRDHPELAGIKSCEWSEICTNKYDVAIIATAHECVDHNAIAGLVSMVVDTRGVCKAADNIINA